MAEKKTNIHTINTIVIVILALMLIAVLWIPRSIWDDEAEIRTVAQHRMIAINEAEKVFYVLSESYTPYLDVLFDVVKGVYDSVQVAGNDTNITYFGDKTFIFPQDSIIIDNTPGYQAEYTKLHRELFDKLDPSHYLQPEQVAEFIERVRMNYANGNYIGRQTMKVGEDSLEFIVPNRFNILYQNGKFRMFNVLTGSATQNEKFANPLVEAVMDTVLKNDQLRGDLTFDSLYTTIDFSYTVDSKFADLLKSTAVKLRKYIKFSAEDSTKYGESIYAEAVANIMATRELPVEVQVRRVDSLNNEISMSAAVDVEGLQKEIATRLNTLYKSLSGGYNEPNFEIARRLIKVVTDSLRDNPDFMGEKKTTLDLSDVSFTINISRTIALNQVKINRDIYVALQPWLIQIPKDSIAASVVEFMVDTLTKRNDQADWQIYSVSDETLNIKIPKAFMRQYDDMNMNLYQDLTGQFTNVNVLANNTVRKVHQNSLMDTLGFKGKHTIHPDTITVAVTVKPDYQALYDSSFVTRIDTVIAFSDSSFIGVWSRSSINLTLVDTPSELPFVGVNSSGALVYHAGMADSVKEQHVLELEMSNKSEEAFLGESAYVVEYKTDSTLVEVYRIVQPLAEDSTNTPLVFTVVSPRFIVGIQEKPYMMQKDSFGAWVDTTIANKFKKIQTHHLYKLTDAMKYDPVTGKPFRVTVRNQVNLRIESPIEDQIIRTNRYLFFTQEDSTSGRIIDGEYSWASN